ncbi:benzoate/H(+) symporter BenE family transporter [Shewanella sp. FJAT-51649]|uniref:benzoate/H(+) symporter BenE family transporter n=1 Tax=Shewanella sp. FJAT-51649 TaxID=2864210 RepID=UPI001C6575A2|nr:benzoate/H(+) symporter BenE family transporter [Shewanella sp. FJAT-51649]QYJ73462.1 benzoate/H(+) symporter BenE family transporter [Shewanella sp. FJAT-51649]
MWREALGLSKISAGFIAVLVGYSSSAVIILQAADAVGATSAQMSSWLWALGVGMGLTSIGLSLYYKNPVLTAWSTPGAALMVSSLAGLSIHEAVGAFLISSLLITLCGLAGWMDKLIRIMPPSVAAAMLAGVLLQFGLGLFQAMQTQLSLILLMLLVFVVLKPWAPRYIMLLTLVAGIGMSYQLGLLQLDKLELQFAAPVWIAPTFSIASVVGVALPLFVVTMASQNMPGVAALYGHGYRPPISPLITVTGLMGVLFAPFGGFAFNLSAITAAICMGKEADPNPATRYWAAVWGGVFYLITGLLGATVVGLFAAFPKELVLAIAGLALLGTIGNSLTAALADNDGREVAVITFLVTASGVSILGIGSAFWGLLLGFLMHYWHKHRVLTTAKQAKA